MLKLMVLGQYITDLFLYPAPAVPWTKKSFVLIPLYPSSVFPFGNILALFLKFELPNVIITSFAFHLVQQYVACVIFLHPHPVFAISFCAEETVFYFSG